MIPRIPFSPAFQPIMPHTVMYKPTMKTPNKTRNSPRRTAALALGLFALVFAGCHTGVRPSDTIRSKLLPWKPQLLYVRDQPYRRLCVEVDAVEGCEPADATLAKLKDFLAAHCDKPDGIEIVRRPVIPRNEARGLGAEALACKAMQEPGMDSGTNQAAFLEILFYDGKLTHESGRAPGITEWEPYPALIIMNASSFSIRHFEGAMLTHEAGHALGLVGRTNDFVGDHCDNPQCLMYPHLKMSVQVPRVLYRSGAFTTSQTNFCTNCLAELADSTAQPPPTNIYFDGPVFVRSEKAYHVLSLPDHAQVVAGKLTEEDCSNLVAAARARPLLSGHVSFTAKIKEEVTQDPARVQELIDGLAADPLAEVRWAGTEMCMQHGQLAGAVKISTRSIQEDPKDDFSHNALAWIEATAPEASLRDGRKAVTDATKACELTKWKRGSWIDTLAAAYAESGDFQQAVKYEKLALRTGDPTDPEQKEMRARLALYQQSEPFRDRQ
jgi:hypothetical protein